MSESRPDKSWLDALARRGARFEGDRVVGFGASGQRPDQTRTTASIAPLLSDGLILATGEDAETFLQGQLSNDVNQVSSARGQLAAYCSAQGRVLATLLLWKREDDYVLQLPRELTGPIARRLQMYVLRSRVRLTVASDEIALIGLTGKGCTELVNRELGVSLSAEYQTGTALGVTALALPGDRVQVAVAVERASEIWDQLVHGAAPADQGSWDRATIASGIASVTLPTQDQFVPQMLNLELVGGVSFGKGCYPGQEIVARSQHLGQVKRRLARFAGAQHASAGDPVLARGQQVGTVVNTAPSGAGWELLAVVQRDLAEQTLSLGAEASPLHPLPLPYALPGAPAERVGDRG